jgi:hypothetical protein
MARDSAGRTRREQEVVMLGPLAALQRDQPRLIVITDPEKGIGYTIDDRARTARRQDTKVQIKSKLGLTYALTSPKTPLPVTALGAGKIWRIASGGDSSKVNLEGLGTRRIEGVDAEGTRTSVTIPEGAVGNLRAIEVVTERWFSKDLQADVLITRRDPRSGDTVYRLTNIVRAEPPADLFEVPAGYTIVSESLKKTGIVAKKLKTAAREK